MRKVLLYSLLLVGGLLASQVLPESAQTPVRIGTLLCLSFIMIHVGYEFEIDKSNPRQYAWDYFVAFTAAAFPWVFVAVYFVFVMAPPELWWHPDLWKENLLTARFASPTSAGVLFSMLAAAGLAATWVFRKARILAIFDDLDTILLMVPLKMMIVGFRWQLAVIVLFIGAMLVLAWVYLHRIRLPIGWKWVLLYSALIVGASELVYIGSKQVDRTVPIHLEVLLPAFALGCVLRRPAGADPHSDDHLEGVEEGPEAANEQRVSMIVSACFMVLVGLSMPSIRQSAPLPADGGGGALTTAELTQGDMLDFDGADPAALVAKDAFPGWGTIALHVLAVTVLSNLGKMYPAFCYRREAHWRERLAVAVGMFPRGEVGAGVLVVSIAYGIGGPTLTVAALSLALNLLLTGVFIIAVKRLLVGVPGGISATAGA